jgi:hypothetical protein
MDKEKKNKFEITEMFMAKTSPDNCFFGCIKRLKDENGNPFVFSRIKMNDGLLCASANDQKILGKNLDEMCVMILDKGLHNDAGVKTKIFETDFFLN